VSTISHERIQENEVMISLAALCKLENDPGLADRTNLTPTQIADLLNFVLRSTYFQYNGSIYKQKDGAAMGSPVSAVIANLYMEESEERAIATATYKPKIWKRYVDDTFTILGKDYVDGFLQHLQTVNSLLFVLLWKSRKITLFLFSTRSFKAIKRSSHNQCLQKAHPH